MEFKIRKAHSADIPEVVAILAECSAWLKTKGIVQWPDRFPETLIASAVESGNLHIATGASIMVATITLQWRDPMFWGAREDAGFVRRFAVRRSHAGVGPLLLDWAAQQALLKGREYLCLDCLSTNHRLRRYYEDLGFRSVREVSGSSDHPHGAAANSWHAVLYEKLLSGG